MEYLIVTLLLIIIGLLCVDIFRSRQAKLDTEGKAVFSMAASKDPSLAERIESGMKKAVEDALKEGISINDSDKLREVQLAARNKVLGR